MIGLFAALVIISSPVQAETKIDLNRATLEEIKSLPIPEKVAESIYDYIYFEAYLSSVYELRDIPGVNQELFEEIKPLVRIERVYEEDPQIQRVNMMYSRLNQWGATEGTNEGIVDVWIELAKDPMNVNQASFDQLASLQNVSPQDAAAVYDYTQRDQVDSRSELRSIGGLSGWGYYNMRNFISYGRPEEKEEKLRGSFQFRVYDSPYFSDVEDLLNEDANPAEGVSDSWWSRLDMDRADPAVVQKLNLRYGTQIKAGSILHRNLGDQSSLSWKAFAGAEGYSIGNLEIRKLYVGNYMLSFGQGLVMENTDFFKTRKSGYGWDKRYRGIVGDISRNEEFQLTGIAAHMAAGPVDWVVFYSDDWKDAVLNSDGTVNQYIILTPRIENDDLEDYGLQPMNDVLHEQTFGANVRFSFKPGTYLSFTGYESRYNRWFDPKFDPDDPQDKSPLVPDDEEDNLTAADAEYYGLYKSPGKYRRVFGADFQAVYKNMTFQGEWATLDADGEISSISDDPWAIVLNSYIQFNNLDLLAIYRNYELDFDNPYNRGFSNYQRYKGSVFEDEYYLEDPLYGLLYDNAVQPQAEEGIYFSSRYRLSDKLTPSIEYDSWKRKTDGAAYYRFVGKLTYQPIFAIRLRLRQQYQSRYPDNDLSVLQYDLWNTRFVTEFRLSRYDEVSVLYWKSFTKWPPRPRLADNVSPDGGHPLLGGVGEPSEALGAEFTHNFSDRLKVRFSYLSYTGFIWTFEDPDFVITDKERASRFWFLVVDRISDRLSLRFKYTVDKAKPTGYVDARQYNEPFGDEPDGWYVRDDDTSYRLQIDYMW
jgi:hypothetical protein